MTVKKAKRVLFISQEIAPYSSENGMSVLARLLPKQVLESGDDVRVFMPCYGTINERRNQLHEVIRLSGINVIVDDTDHPLIVKVASIPDTRVQVYFVDNDEFFKRKTLFGTSAKVGHNDNADRSIFFVRAALEAIKKLRWVPDIIHCAGWFAAIAPLYLKTVYKDDPALGKSKVVFTLYPEESKGVMSEDLFDKLAFDKITEEQVALMGGSVALPALYKLAVHYADAVALFPPHTNEEIDKLLEEYPDKQRLILEDCQEDVDLTEYYTPLEGK